MTYLALTHAHDPICVINQLQVRGKRNAALADRLARISRVFKAVSLPGKFAIKNSDKFRLACELTTNLGKQDMKLRKYIRNYVDG